MTATPDTMECAQVLVRPRGSDSEVFARVYVHQGAAAVTPAEFALLREIHGTDNVQAVVLGDLVSRTPAAEKQRLVDLYGGPANGDLDQRRRDPRYQRVEQTFPGLHALMPRTFSELGVLVPRPKAAPAKRRDVPDPLE